MSLTFRSQPRISRELFTRVLERYGSPCAAQGGECYDIICSYGLDPAVALGFFGHESVFGTRGVAVETLNWGNVRTPVRVERVTGTHPRNFAIFRSWQDGLRDWANASLSATSTSAAWIPSIKRFLCTRRHRMATTSGDILSMLSSSCGIGWQKIRPRQHQLPKRSVTICSWPRSALPLPSIDPTRPFISTTSTS